MSRTREGGFQSRQKCGFGRGFWKEKNSNMIRSMFSGVAGLRTHQKKMDVIGNNIANVNTVGYKTARAVFSESIYQTSRNSSSGNTIIGGINPSQVGYGCQLTSIDVDYGASSYEPTGFGTDCMIDGNGFFMVGPKLGVTATVDAGIPNTEDDSGASRLSLTRIGSFKFDGDGYLVDGNGNCVYGFVQDGGESAEGDTLFVANTELLVPIRIPNADDSTVDYANTLRLNLSDLSIGADGVITGKEADGTIHKFGCVAVCNVPNANALDKVQNSYYSARNNTGSIMAYNPGEGTTGALISNGLEQANVDLATEFSSMITTERGFQANSKIITVSDEMLQELISMKR